MQGTQAKILSTAQERAILGSLTTTRYPVRDRVMFLLSLNWTPGEGNRRPHLGHGDRRQWSGRGRAPPPQPRE